MTSQWWRDAACKGMDINIFFPERTTLSVYSTPRQICVTCPVKTECLNEADEGNIQYGMWGGLTPHQRRSNRQRSVPLSPDEIGHGDTGGTPKGYWREVYQGIKPCDDCITAYRAYNAERTATRRHAKAQ